MQPLISRRRVIQAGLGAATGLWVAGFATAITGTGVHLLVTGDNEWQCIALTVRRARIVILSGTFEDWPTDTLALMLGTFRQRIDVVIASSQALALLPNPVPDGLQRATRIAMDAPTSGTRTFTGDVDLAIEDVHLRLRRSYASTWSRDVVPVSMDIQSIVEITVGTQRVTISQSFENILRLSPLTSSLLIAPSGNPAGALQAFPGSSIVVNQHRVDSSSRDFGPVADLTGRYVVRAFPQDVAHLTLTKSSISLPDWAQELSTLV